MTTAMTIVVDQPFGEKAYQDAIPVPIYVELVVVVVVVVAVGAHKTLVSVEIVFDPATS